MELVRELIKNDVLVLQTGCSQIALAKAGFCTPEAAYLAGPGLSEVCETVGMPPVLGLGSCVDNSKSMGVRPTQLTENRKSRLAKLLQILTAYHVFLWPKRREL